MKGEDGEKAGFVIDGRGDDASARGRRGAGLCLQSVADSDHDGDANSVAVGEPVTFSIVKANVLPSDLAWSARDHLPESMEFVSATPSQGTCALSEGTNVVQCDLGVVPSWDRATIDITATPTELGETMNYVADDGENEASVPSW